MLTANLVYLPIFVLSKNYLNHISACSILILYFILLMFNTYTVTHHLYWIFSNLYILLGVGNVSSTI